MFIRVSLGLPLCDTRRLISSRVHSSAPSYVLGTSLMVVGGCARRSGSRWSSGSWAVLAGHQFARSGPGGSPVQMPV